MTATAQDEVSSDSKLDDSAASLPALDAGAEQQDRWRSKNGPSSSHSPYNPYTPQPQPP